MFVGVQLLLVTDRVEECVGGIKKNCGNKGEPLAKVSFRPISALCSKFYPRNIHYMPVVKFFHMP